MVYKKTKIFRCNSINLNGFKDIALLSIQETLALETNVKKMDDHLFIIEFLKESKIDLLQDNKKMYIGLTAEVSKELTNPFWKKFRYYYYKALKIRKSARNDIYNLKFLELVIVILLGSLGILFMFTEFSIFLYGPLHGLILFYFLLMAIIAVIKITNFQYHKFSYKTYYLCTIIQIATALIITIPSLIIIEMRSLTLMNGIIIFIMYLSIAALLELFISAIDFLIIYSLLDLI